MTSMIVGVAILIALVLLLDWKVLRALPSSNRWITCSLFVISLGLFIYHFKFQKTYPTEVIGRLIKSWSPFH